MSDVFSFELIVYELLVGQSAFPETWTIHHVLRNLIMDKRRPNIPEFILPESRKLITDCWADEPGERLSFDEIMERLVKMKFKLIPNVNSWKLSEFVRNIEAKENVDILN
jgi:hypothetical protein